MNQNLKDKFIATIAENLDWSLASASGRTFEASIRAEDGSYVVVTLKRISEATYLGQE